jgi:hypothetical protein
MFWRLPVSSWVGRGVAAFIFVVPFYQIFLLPIAIATYCKPTQVPTWRLQEPVSTVLLYGDPFSSGCYFECLALLNSRLIKSVETYVLRPRSDVFSIGQGWNRFARVDAAETGKRCRAWNELLDSKRAGTDSDLYRSLVGAGNCVNVTAGAQPSGELQMRNQMGERRFLGIRLLSATSVLGFGGVRSELVFSDNRVIQLMLL